VAAGDPARLESPVKFEAEVGGETIAIEVTGQDGHYRVAIGSEITDVDARQAAEGIWSLVIGTVSHVVDVSERDGVSVVEVDGETYRIRVEEETRYIIRTRGGKAATGGQVLRAPMPGKVVHVGVEVGQEVKPGDGLVVLEAMKMENEFRAAVTGTVKEIRVRPGQTVNPGDALVVIE
jgi:biotin carboxyl carrier protein